MIQKLVEIAAGEAEGEEQGRQFGWRTSRYYISPYYPFGPFLRFPPSPLLKLLKKTYYVHNLGTKLLPPSVLQPLNQLRSVVSPFESIKVQVT
jgi:hypothetical protein